MKQNNSTSVGFCFLNAKEYEPEYAIHFLSGLVSNEICAVFEVDPKNLKKTFGKYAKPLKSFEELFMPIETFIANEYCTSEYSNKTFKLVEYAKPELFDFEYKKWKFTKGG